MRLNPLPRPLTVDVATRFHRPARRRPRRHFVPVRRSCCGWGELRHLGLQHLHHRAVPQQDLLPAQVPTLRPRGSLHGLSQLYTITITHWIITTLHRIELYVAYSQSYARAQVWDDVVGSRVWSDSLMRDGGAPIHASMQSLPSLLRQALLDGKLPSTLATQVHYIARW